MQGSLFLRNGLAFVVSLFCLFQLIVCNDSPKKGSCTRSCTLKDKDLESCWKQSVTHFSKNLQDAIVEYSGTIMHTEIWKQRNPEMSEKYEDFEMEILEEALSDYDDEANVLSKSDLVLIFKDIMNMTSAHEHRYSDGEILPKFGCPIPCLYDSSMLHILSGVLFATLIIMIVCFIVYFIRTQRKLERLTRQKLFVPNS